MKIYLLLAHPDKDSFNGQIADAFYTRAIERGHEVRYQQIGELRFDPILWKGYKAVQELEPDLEEARQNILWCDRWVMAYPVWWGNLPALFKGFIDRVLSSGFAYQYHQKDPFWDKLLKGRTAEVITTSDAPKWWLWWQYRNSDINALKRATLEFCGIEPVTVKRITRVKYLSDAERKRKMEAICNDIPIAVHKPAELKKQFQP